MRTPGGMGWWIEMGPNGSNEVRIRDGVGGSRYRGSGGSLGVEPGGQLRWCHPCLSPHSPFSILGPLMFSSPLYSSWVPDMLVAEKSGGRGAWPGSGDSLVGEVRHGSQHHWTMKPHPNCLGHCPPLCHYRFQFGLSAGGSKKGEAWTWERSQIPLPTYTHTFLGLN